MPAVGAAAVLLVAIDSDGVVRTGGEDVPAAFGTVIQVIAALCEHLFSVCRKEEVQFVLVLVCMPERRTVHVAPHGVLPP